MTNRCLQSTDFITKVLTSDSHVNMKLKEKMRRDFYEGQRIFITSDEYSISIIP